MPSSSGPLLAQWFLGSTVRLEHLRSTLKRYANGSWQAVQGSASGQGVSMSSTGVQDMRLAVDNQKIAIAWAAKERWNRAVYVREYNGSQWQFLGSANNSDALTSNAGGIILLRSLITPISCLHLGKHSGWSRKDLAARYRLGSQPESAAWTEWGYPSTVFMVPAHNWLRRVVCCSLRGHKKF